MPKFVCNCHYMEQNNLISSQYSWREVGLLQKSKKLQVFSCQVETGPKSFKKLHECFC